MANFKRMTGAYTDGLCAMPSMTWPEGSTQSFAIGDLLVASSGTAVIGADDPTNGTILGIAEGPATGTTGADCRFTPALPHVTFEGTLDIAAGTYALDGTEIGVKYEIELDSGIFYIKQDSTTAVKVVVVGLKDAVGTVSGRVYFKFLRGASVFDQAAV